MMVEIVECGRIALENLLNSKFFTVFQDSWKVVASTQCFYVQFALKSGCLCLANKFWKWLAKNPYQI